MEKNLMTITMIVKNTETMYGKMFDFSILRKVLADNNFNRYNVYIVDGFTQVLVNHFDYDKYNDYRVIDYDVHPDEEYISYMIREPEEGEIHSKEIKDLVYNKKYMTVGDLRRILDQEDNNGNKVPDEMELVIPVINESLTADEVEDTLGYRKVSFCDIIDSYGDRAMVFLNGSKKVMMPSELIASTDAIIKKPLYPKEYTTTINLKPEVYKYPITLCMLDKLGILNKMSKMGFNVKTQFIEDDDYNLTDNYRKYYAVKIDKIIQDSKEPVPTIYVDPNCVGFSEDDNKSFSEILNKVSSQNGDILIEDFYKLGMFFGTVPYAVIEDKEENLERGFRTGIFFDADGNLGTNLCDDPILKRKIVDIGIIDTDKYSDSDIINAEDINKYIRITVE